MNTEITSSDISAAALRVFSRTELQQMPKPMLLSVASLIRKAMVQRGVNLDQEELEGIRELVTEHLYPTNFAELSAEFKNNKGES